MPSSRFLFSTSVLERVLIAKALTRLDDDDKAAIAEMLTDESETITAEDVAQSQIKLLQEMASV